MHAGGSLHWGVDRYRREEGRGLFFQLGFGLEACDLCTESSNGRVPGHDGQLTNSIRCSQPRSTRGSAVPKPWKQQ